MTDIEVVREALQLATWSDAAEDYKRATEGKFVLESALAALDSLEAELAQAREDARGNHEVWSEKYQALARELAQAREERDALQRRLDDLVEVSSQVLSGMQELYEKNEKVRAALTGETTDER